ncbi:MAG: hypothetical protein ACOCWB_07290 [Bacteroidota bacterium]
MKTINLYEFLKHTTKCCVILTVLCAGLVFSNCDNKKQDPYITIKDGDGAEISGDTISVGLNSVHEVLFDVVYKRGEVLYIRQIDSGTIEDLTNEHEDLRILSHGVNEYTNQFEHAIVTTHFADTVLDVGSLVKISVRVGAYMMESTYYKVTE